MGHRRAGFLPLAFLLLFASGAGAQSVQIAPFAGYQFGGSLYSPVYGQPFSFKADLDYGATLDIALGPTWRIELMYSRQPTELKADAGGPAFDVTVEHYMVGVQEEKGEGSLRYFGVALLGATRFVPGLSGYGSESRFTVGLGLGVKSFFTRQVGVRFEFRGFYAIVESEGGVICSSGQCLFSFSGSGFWQADVSGGLVIAF